MAAARDVTRVDVRRRDVAIDPREEQAVTLEGDLWRVVVEANDCDLHLELSAPGGGVDAPRVIAEVPAGPGCQAARAAVLRVNHLPSGRTRDGVDLTALEPGPSAVPRWVAVGDLPRREGARARVRPRALSVR